MNNQQDVGSVLVVGGGIAGMQASLDLAESGYKVYLLESAPAIGGKMVQLDKTFPTGDCAMCTVAPRLTECGRHKNIEVITTTEIEKVEGRVGNFKVTVRKSPRYVDEKKCNACGDCEKVCPVKVDNTFDYKLSKRTAIYKLYPQSIPNIYAVDKQGISPCRLSCPAGVNAHGFIALIRAGKYREALDLVRESIPFAAVCGRICTHPCESECSRKEIDEPIAICALKRFISDLQIENSPQSAIPNPQSPNLPISDFSIAVIGAGPAGLTCAYHLAKMGYRVTVFEAFSVAGGMLKISIPDFRLPQEIVDKEIEFIKSTGVEIQTNVTVGKDISFNKLREQYKAVFIAVGAPKSKQLQIDGETLTGVYPGIDFLTSVKSGKKQTVGNRVIVMGGGNTAIDAARTAVRLGAGEVFIMYRRTRNEMPAIPEEINRAEEEGVRIEYLTAPIKINGDNGKATSVSYIKMKLGEPDRSGRRKPIPIKGTESTLSVDTVIIAIGQYSDTGFLPQELKDEQGNIKVDLETLTTSLSGIFAGGDVVTGPDVLIKAIAAGRKAAISIDRFIKGEKLIPVEFLPSLKKATPHTDGIKQVNRIKIPHLDVKKRISDFQEIELSLNEQLAKQEAERCLNCGVCSECLECVKVCVPAAINHRMNEAITELNVGAIILAPGLETFDATLKEEYGYGRYRDVITSIEFERILSASGPYGGEIRCPSDGKIPQKIAFIQCVGSRDKTVDRDYCSAVCCMYTTKEAIVTKEHLPEVDITVFFIDVRAYGKGFESYYERAKNEYGVNYIRCMVSRVIQHPHTKKLKIRYIVAGSLQEAEFDLVVLAAGLQPSISAMESVKKLGIEFTPFNFCSTDVFTPLNTSQPGIFVAGGFQAPKDIPESVMQGSGSASDVGGILSSARSTLTQRKKFPVEKDIAQEGIRVGVFICHCGKNIASVVDVQNISEQMKKLPSVAHSETNLFTCSPDGLAKIRTAIKEHNLTRVVVASCSHRTHELLFQENLREAGINPYLFEMANIRDQCSWVHSSSHQKATQKAHELTLMAVAKSKYLEPIKLQSVPVNQKALVIGGGLSGMVSAVSLANQGFEVYLVEKENELGGNLNKIYRTLEGNDVQNLLKELVNKVKTNKMIHVYTNAEIKEVSGFIGNFKTTISQFHNSEIVKCSIEHGIIIVATGAQEYKPTEYLYGQDERIITQQELEEKLSSPTAYSLLPTSVVMLQCIGSRNDEHSYCSRICCSAAIKNALKLKEINPQTNIFILYRDIRTYGMKEIYYHQARESDIIFIRYDETNQPVVTIKNGQLQVEVLEPSLNQKISINSDLVVLSTGIVPHSDNEQLASVLKVPLNEDKFFLEAHIKLRPVDFATSGIFLCGLAHSPKFIDENISQAKAAAARAATVLTKEHWEVGGVYAVVSPEKCVACLTCVRVCPYNVPFIIAEGSAEIESAKCHGCGICAGECPAKAIQLQHFKDIQIIAQVEGMIKRVEYLVA